MNIPIILPNVTSLYNQSNSAFVGPETYPSLGSKISWLGYGFMSLPFGVKSKIEDGFEYIEIRSPYNPYSLYLKGTITLNPKP